MWGAWVVMYGVQVQNPIASRWDVLQAAARQTPWLGHAELRFIPFSPGFSWWLCVLRGAGASGDKEQRPYPYTEPQQGCSCRGPRVKAAGIWGCGAALLPVGAAFGSLVPGGGRGCLAEPCPMTNGFLACVNFAAAPGTVTWPGGGDLWGLCPALGLGARLAPAPRLLSHRCRCCGRGTSPGQRGRLGCGAHVGLALGKRPRSPFPRCRGCLRLRAPSLA